MARKVYNDEFEFAAAKLVRDQGYTIKKAAQSLGVDHGSIGTWVRTYAPALAPLATDASPEQLQRENTRLREENRRLLMEWSARFSKKRRPSSRGSRREVRLRPRPQGRVPRRAALRDPQGLA